MKKFFIILASIGIMTACGGGKESTEPIGGSGGGGSSSTTPTITISTGVNTNPVIDAAGGKAEVSFTASDAWTASVINTRADSWVSVSPTSGAKGSTKITIEAKSNDTPDERGATIQIKCGTATKNITLTQKQKDAFTATASKTEIGKDGGNFTIEVKANVSFSYNIDKGGDWIKYIGTKALKTSTITFEVSANEDTDRRDGQITVTSSAGNETFKVYQDGASPTIVLSTHNASVESSGGNFQIDVRHNVDVSVRIQDGANWLRELSSRAMSTNTYVFSADANEDTDSRECDIFFTNNTNGLTETVHVIQAQKNAIVIAQSTYDIHSAGGSFQVTVSHNVDYQVNINASWISSPQNTKAMTTETLTFNVSANDSGASRTGTITFAAGSLTQTITVNQAYTNPIDTRITPGIYNLQGITWTLDSNNRQLFIRKNGEDSIISGFGFGIICPGTNEFVLLTRSESGGEFAVGESVDFNMYQNVDRNKPAFYYVRLVVKEVENSYVWLAEYENDNHFVIIKTDL